MIRLNVSYQLGQLNYKVKLGRLHVRQPQQYTLTHAHRMHLSMRLVQLSSANRCYTIHGFVSICSSLKQKGDCLKVRLVSQHTSLLVSATTTVIHNVNVNVIRT